MVHSPTKKVVVQYIVNIRFKIADFQHRSVQNTNCTSWGKGLGPCKFNYLLIHHHLGGGNPSVLGNCLRNL